MEPDQRSRCICRDTVRKEPGMTRRVIAVLGLAVLLSTIGLPVARAGGFCHEGGNTQKATTSVEMKDNCFYPTVTEIDVGEKVTWRNFDGENHIILGVGGSWGTPEVSPRGATTVRFDNPGVYPYWCHIHLGMVGAVVVGDGKASDGTAAGAGPVATVLSTGASNESPTPDDGKSADSAAPASSERSGVDPALVVAIAALTGGAGFGLARLVHWYIESRKARPGIESHS
jgi:plastocyanin